MAFQALRKKIISPLRWNKSGAKTIRFNPWKGTPTRTCATTNPARSDVSAARKGGFCFSRLLSVALSV
jgi:hypothetical protein